jgi:hypothetical protein
VLVLADSVLITLGVGSLDGCCYDCHMHRKSTIFKNISECHWPPQVFQLQGHETSGSKEVKYPAVVSITPFLRN